MGAKEFFDIWEVAVDVVIDNLQADILSNI